jgi:simple sugar transport system ATP-binding protein
MEGQLESVLEVRHIYKYYDSLAANYDVSIAIEPGKVHAIIGENGAGKSTLMNILSGVIQPSSGEIILNGKSRSFRSANDATGAGIGMVQQEFMLFDGLSVLENIVLGHEDIKNKFFLDYTASEKKIRAICDEYGFHFDLKAKARDLAIVIQQQIEIVKVLFKKAEIIILDEPTAVLPPQEVEGLFRAIRFLVQQGKTILFITHKLKEVLAISDTITVMKNGKKVETLPAIQANEVLLTSMMVGRKVMLNIKKNHYESATPVLRISHLKVLDDRKITKVKDVSFEINKGEILGVVGIAGNGQNELVEAMTGMRSYNAGTIDLLGQVLPGNNPRNNRLRGMSYVSQDRIRVGSSITSTQVENILMGRHLENFKKWRFLMDYQSGEIYAREVISHYDVKTQGIYLKASSLSGGNLQKLIVGREFTQDSRVIIMEDPTRGIDIGAIEFIWNEIVQKAEREGIAVLLITYDLAEAMALSDRILIMYDGMICKVMTGPNYDEKEIGLYMLGGGTGGEASSKQAIGRSF